MKKLLAALLLAYANLAMAAVPIVPVIGHVAAPVQVQVQPSGAKALGVCMWQVPGKLRFINLGAVLEYGVSGDHVVGYSFWLRRDTRGYNDFEIKLPKGEDVMVLPNAIAARIKECYTGEGK